jgi:nicotinate phosphoribosyltransferase
MGSSTIDDDVALLTDLYQLTMLRAYLAEGMVGRAVFSLFVRRLPARRNYLVACGLADVLSYLEQLHFSERALAFIASRPELGPALAEQLATFRFTGDVWAVREGTPVFADEPLLEIEAPLAEAQLVETFVMNQLHLQTLLASKASRVVTAAAGRKVLDFGLRRMQGADAGLKAARAFYVAGVDATSNVLAGERYGIPIAGTMAHSYVQVHDSELDAFRAFAKVHPQTVLLVDTYDTLAGVQNVVRLSRELADRFQIRAIRLDSGDLASLARQARRLLDAAGLDAVEVFASSGLDEHSIAELVQSGAPISGFGVGTKMGVSADAPYLDVVYKLVEYAGHGRLKLSPGKLVRPGRKQVFRVEPNGQADHDVLCGADEQPAGRPLLELVMQDGQRLPTADHSLEELRRYGRNELAKLPERVRALAAAQPPYRVEVSAELERRTAQVAERVTRR